MESRVRATPEQLAKLLEYMETHGDLTRPLAGPQGRIRSDRLWRKLTNILNAVSGGVSKTTDKWKKVWADWKSKTKKKALTIKHHATGTGGGPASGQTLSASDKRVLAIMGPLAVAGEVRIGGLNRPLSTAKDDPDAQDDPLADSMFFEILDGTPQVTSSPDPSTSQPSNNWLPPTSSYHTTPSPVPLVLTPTSAQDRQSVAPDPPATAAPAARATLRCRRLPGTATISPATGRRLRLRSPATPQSAASLDRPGLRARQRQAPTAFERAASEFTAIELRRLELEEARNRLQHERDMRALEVEHERNQVFSRLVNVAEAWLDYNRSTQHRTPEH